MYCAHCGKSNDNASKFCFSCGKEMGAPAAQTAPAPGAYAPQQTYPYYSPPMPKKTNNTATIGLILAFLAPMVGLILSIMARKQCIENNEEGQGLATAGIIVSAISMVVSFILMFFFIFGAIGMML